MRDVQVLGEKREKNNKNYLLKNNLNNLRGNQLPAALKESHVSVN